MVMSKTYLLCRCNYFFMLTLICIVFQNNIYISLKLIKNRKLFYFLKFIHTFSLICPCNRLMVDYNGILRVHLLQEGICLFPDVSKVENEVISFGVQVRVPETPSKRI